MKQTEDHAGADRQPADSGRLPDEDLDAVTGGLMHPPEPSGSEHRRIDGRSDTGHDETADA